MRQVWFVRHAESAANVGAVEFDPPLTANGVSQSESLSGHFDIVILSPMRRCIETLQFSQITYGNKTESDNLREWKRDYPPTRLHKDEKSETKEEFEARVEKFKEELAAIDAKTILVIGHSYFWNVWRKIESPYYEIPNASIVQVIGA